MGETEKRRRQKKQRLKKEKKRRNRKRKRRPMIPGGVLKATGCSETDAALLSRCCRCAVIFRHERSLRRGQRRVAAGRRAPGGREKMRKTHSRLIKVLKTTGVDQSSGKTTHRRCGTLDEPQSGTTATSSIHPATAGKYPWGSEVVRADNKRLKEECVGHMTRPSGFFFLQSGIRVLGTVPLLAKCRSGREGRSSQLSCIGSTSWNAQTELFYIKGWRQQGWATKRVATLEDRDTISSKAQSVTNLFYTIRKSRQQSGPAYLLLTVLLPIASLHVEEGRQIMEPWEKGEKRNNNGDQYLIYWFQIWEESIQYLETLQPRNNRVITQNLFFARMETKILGRLSLTPVLKMGFLAVKGAEFYCSLRNNVIKKGGKKRTSREQYSLQSVAVHHLEDKVVVHRGGKYEGRHCKLGFSKLRPDGSCRIRHQ